jgi:hypothetical protein
MTHRVKNHSDRILFVRLDIKRLQAIVEKCGLSNI